MAEIVKIVRDRRNQNEKKKDRTRSWRKRDGTTMIFRSVRHKKKSPLALLLRLVTYYNIEGRNDIVVATS